MIIGELEHEKPLLNSIRDAVKIKVDEIVAEEARKAAMRVEQQVRECSAAIAARILHHYDMQTRGEKLVITVDFSGVNKNA